MVQYLLNEKQMKLFDALNLILRVSMNLCSISIFQFNFPVSESAVCSQYLQWPPTFSSEVTINFFIEFFL